MPVCHQCVRFPTRETVFRPTFNFSMVTANPFGTLRLIQQFDWTLLVIVRAGPKALLNQPKPESESHNPIRRGGRHSAHIFGGKHGH